jgi:hypothetical protein
MQIARVAKTALFFEISAFFSNKIIFAGFLKTCLTRSPDKFATTIFFSKMLHQNFEQF